MSDVSIDQEYEILQGQAGLRYEIVRKKIERYFQAVERALATGKPLPPPESGDDEQK
ncbi:hypothetical protein K8I61_12995 [bacterium]|nr:hypothetical protein [bacterium]